MNTNKNEIKVLVTSEYWAQNEITMSLSELENQAETYTKDRIGSGDIEELGPVSIKVENGKVFDDQKRLVGLIVNG